MFQSDTLILHKRWTQYSFALYLEIFIHWLIDSYLFYLFYMHMSTFVLSVDYLLFYNCDRKTQILWLQKYLVRIVRLIVTVC